MLVSIDCHKDTNLQPSGERGRRGSLLANVQHSPDGFWRVDVIEVLCAVLEGVEQVVSPGLMLL